MCNAVAVVVVVAFFMVSVLYYSAFRSLLLLLFVLLFYLGREGSTRRRCQINKPALACLAPKSNYTNNNLAVGNYNNNTYTHSSSKS